MIKKGLPLLLLVSALVLTGCGNTQNGGAAKVGDNTTLSSALSSNSGSSEAKSEATKTDTDKAAILGFYDSLLSVYKDTANGSGKTIKSMVDSTRNSIEQFDKLDASSSEYGDYIRNMQNNSLLSLYKTRFMENEAGTDFDYHIFKNAYLTALHKLVGRILCEVLPFEYENQLQDDGQNNSVNNEKSYNSVKANMIDYVNEMAKSGIPIQQHEKFYGYPEDKLSEYDVEGAKISYGVGIDFGELSRSNFSLNFFIYDYYKTPNSISFISGEQEITFYSSQFSASDPYLYDVMMIFLYIHNTDYSDSVNSQYNELKKLFNTTDNITVRFDDQLDITLKSEDIENTRAWFAFYDVLRQEIEG